MSPNLPSQPLQARLEDPGQNIAILVAKAERHLASQPDDGRGWDVIASVYLRTGRASEAESAYRNALQLSGPDVRRLGGLTEALMAKADRSVTAETVNIPRQILQLEPKNPCARFYAAHSMEQAGRRHGGRQAFEALAKHSPASSSRNGWQPSSLSRHRRCSRDIGPTPRLHGGGYGRRGAISERSFVINRWRGTEPK
ncbi:tetratricopeptide repeat protein [Rhizobium leguminosarum]|uniref:tetratricopeptide repeat protein n=1 Tax=Rhizobium leguminosarum TaxID=384 RepID=UPI003D7C1869